MMKLFVVILLLVSVSSYADNALLGKWKDKANPIVYQYEFAENNNFIYRHATLYSGKRYVNVSKGSWEAGDLSITSNKSGTRTSCRLTIYVKTKECCFDYKFLASNLILTKKYSTERNGAMCESRVLIRASRK